MKMKVKELSHTEIQLREDGIVVIRCKEDHQYEIDDVKEIVFATGELIGDKKLPTLTIPGKYSEATKEVLDFIFSNESTVYASADAYIVNSLSQKIIGNFYLKLKKPGIPTRLFTNEKTAIEWLKKNPKVK